MIRHDWPTPQQPSRVVILGGSGFVGRYVVAHLASVGIETVSVASTQVDLCAPTAVEQLRQLVRSDDALVFLSALTPEKGRDIRTFMKNLAMGEHVAAALARSPCAHVSYLSSDAVYADGISLVRETSCASPAAFYGLMHVARERMLQQVVQDSRTPLLVLRPCAVYGGGDTHNAYGPNRFLRSAIADRRIRLFGQGEERRDHLFVGDLSRLIGLCLTHRTSGVLNVATGLAVSFGDLARMIASLCDDPVRIESQPRQGSVTHRHFDTTALLRAFPMFRCTPLASGLAETKKGMPTSASLREPAPVRS